MHCYNSFARNKVTFLPAAFFLNNLETVETVNLTFWSMKVTFYLIAGPDGKSMQLHLHAPVHVISKTGLWFVTHLKHCMMSFWICS